MTEEEKEKPSPLPRAPIFGAVTAQAPEPVIDEPAIATAGPFDATIDAWFARTFVGSRLTPATTELWNELLAAKEHLKSLLN